MKNLIHTGKAIIIIYIIATATGCDKIEGPYSDVNTNPVVVDTTDTITNTIYDTISGTIYDLQRNVLLEDYTGHKCQGCPAAHDEAGTIQSVIGKKLSIIAVHVGYWANTNPSGSFTYDFETQTAVELYPDMLPGSQPFPTGTVNRAMNGSNRVVNYPDWGAKVDELLQPAADASMRVVTSFNATTRVITADVRTTFLDNLTGDYSLAVYFTEDSIVNWQAFPSPQGNNPDYLHRHVLRGALTTTYGNVVATNPVYAQQINTNFVGSPIAADIDLSHVHVLAILTNTATKEVVQVEEVQLRY